MGSKPQYPYQNRSLENLPNEIWRDIPRYDGEYQVSNLGRIKSLSRWHAVGPNAGYYTKEIMRAQYDRISENKLLDQTTHSIGITLKQNGKAHSTSTARYVYWAFAGHFDLEDKQFMISYKDFDGKNIKAFNLILSNNSEIQKRSIGSKRAIPTFTKGQIEIRQQTVSGKIIAKYKSLTEAERKTGISLSGISNCLHGHIFQFKGYRWETIPKTNAAKLSQPRAKPIFNEYLWAKIGKPASSKKTPIPVLNNNPDDLKGERWKPMATLETSYQISNFGRVRALPRFKHGINHVWTKGKILNLVADGNQSKNTGCLLVALTKNGHKFQQSVARLVFHHFVKKIDLNNRKIRIGSKNGKYYDLRAQNLFIKATYLF